MSEEIILHLELVPGRNVDAELAGQALIAWTRLVREVAKHAVPGEELQIDLVGIPEGSLDFKQVFRWIEGTAKTVADGASEFPYLAKGAKALATAALGAGVAVLMMPDVQEVRIVSDEQLSEQQQKVVAASPSVQSASETFFDLLQRDPAIAEVGVTERVGAEPIYSVPREQFPERSGLWSMEFEDQHGESARTITDEWEVVIVKPAAVSKPRSWRFSRDGVEFSALMNDQAFLAAIADGRVPITLQEGVIMKVRVTWRERLEGQIWQTVAQSRKITAVLSPRPLPGPTSLPFPDHKKENH